MNDLPVKGVVFNVQRFSTDDGDGIRTVVFLKGCPLKCKWCHNIESQNFSTEIAYYSRNCIMCGSCVEVCENNCHRIINGNHIFDRTNCTLCGKCINECYSNALEFVGKEYTTDEIIDIVKKDKDFYGEHGGVTVSGGEPMSQFDFLFELAGKSKKEGFSFMIETSGFGKNDNFKRLTPLCDCYLFDCKANSKDHKNLIGSDDEIILKNLDTICELNANVILRCPIIPGENLNEEFLKKIAFLSRKYRNIKSVQLMPYHKTGIGKSDNLGLSRQEEYEIPKKELMKKTAEELKKYGIDIPICM